MELRSPKVLKSSTSGTQQIFTLQFAVEAVNNQDEVGLDRWKQNSELFLGQLAEKSLLCLYRARNKITQLSIPTHAQLQRHRLKFIKNHLNNFCDVAGCCHITTLSIKTSSCGHNNSDFSEDIITP